MDGWRTVAIFLPFELIYRVWSMEGSLQIVSFLYLYMYFPFCCQQRTFHLFSKSNVSSVHFIH